MLTCDDAGRPTGVAGAFTLAPVGFDTVAACTKSCAPNDCTCLQLFAAWETRVEALRAFGDLPVVAVRLHDPVGGGAHPRGRRQEVVEVQLNPWCRFGDHLRPAVGLAPDGAGTRGLRCLFPTCGAHEHPLGAARAFEEVAAEMPVPLTRLAPLLGQALADRRRRAVWVDPPCRCAGPPLRLGRASYFALLRAHLLRDRTGRGHYLCPNTGVVLTATRDEHAPGFGVVLAAVAAD